MTCDRLNRLTWILAGQIGLAVLLSGCERVTQVVQKAGGAAQKAGWVTEDEAEEAAQQASLISKGEVGTVAQDAGLVTEEEAGSINRSAEALKNSWKQLTPKQEHYIGRGVVAQVLQTYSPMDEPAANGYLNLLGQTLAIFSDRPETFDGYHFLLLDSDEINAFAAPDGLILVTRGMVNCCQGEDELAAVLAHEICHVELSHGLKAIKQQRLVDAVALIAKESASQSGDEDLNALTDLFEGSVGDVVETLMINGYSREQERDADLAAVQLLRRAGYPEGAMITMLHRMDERLGRSGGLGFTKTHPSAKSRVETLTSAMASTAYVPNATRQARFQTSMKPILAAQ